ncbi:glutathione S-transferase-like protein [Mycena alexandri]|uniref:glutathione transferase n=1 Tax=Mycena alexandri TaxID=1745969 RepID=A0AAD6SDF1_9AGAR|nr:glutathione S-transferase-like protein [Mycena alexandri]
MLKLYGIGFSSCTRRVAVVCKELNVPYELIAVDILKGEQRSAEHLARQPFGVVPAIEDDGFDLFESRAIGRYIVAKYGAGTTLVPDPKDIFATAKFEQAVSIENNNFDPTASQLMLELVIKPARGLPLDAERVTALRATLDGKLDAYEKILGKHKYLAGDILTIADLFHLPCVVVVQKAKLDLLESRPNVARWYNEISARPAWQAVKDSA